MKHLLYSIGCVILLSFSLVSCGARYQYKDLDGMWQGRLIEFTDGRVEEPRDLYYSFQLHIVNVKRQRQGEAYGRFEYRGDSIHVHMMGQTPKSVGIYAMDDTIQHFWVEKNTDSQLILRSGYARLHFRKY